MANKKQENSFTSKLPGGNPLYFKVETTYQTDANGNPIRGSALHTLKYNPGNGTYYPAATTKDFKTFELKKYTPAEIVNAGIAQYAQPDGTVLGPTAATSLQTGGGVLNRDMSKAVANASLSEGLSPGQAQAVQGTPQTLPNEPTQTPTDGSTPVVDTSPNVIDFPGGAGPGENKQIAPAGARYPLTLKDGDMVEFTALKIEPRQLNLGGSVTSFGIPERGYTKADGPVFIGIQAPISDQNTVAWQSGEINSIDAFMLNASLNLMKSDNAAQTGGDLVQEAFKQAGENAPQVQLYLASQAAGVSNVVSRYGNQVLNPNLELLFQGPQLRPFTFQFKMSARSGPEASQIKQIIKFFKFNMAVKESSNKIFLNSPRVFKIRYLYGGKEDHSGLNLIKVCALQSFSVDYTPLGSYATFNDGTMVRYDLNMQFQEVEPIYDTDYEDVPENAIGF
jgi:hypothetical protein